jgi:LEA14-like dessication related protein
MSLARYALTLAVFALPLGGCAKGINIPGLNLEQFMPKVKFKRLNVKDVDFQGIDTDFVFTIDNPNPIKVKLASFSYDLDLAGEGFLNGNNASGLALEPRGESKLVFPVSTQFADIIKLAGNLKGKDGVPFAFAGKIGFNTPLGEVKIPFKEDGTFPVVQAPKFAFKGVRVGKLNLLNQSATIEVDLGVSHKGGSAMDFSKFDYSLKFGGKKVIEGLIDDLATVQAGQEKTVTLPVQLNLLTVGTTVVQAITKKSKLDVGLDADLDVKTPFGVIPLHIDETGKLQVK